MDISSSAPVIKVKGNLRAKTKATKVGKPSKSQRRATTLKERFPSVSQKIPDKVNNPQKVVLLEKLYPELTPQEQEKFRSLKMHALNKASHKLKRAAKANAEV